MIFIWFGLCVLLGSPTYSSAYDGLSDFLGEVFRGLMGEQRQPAPAVMAQQFPPPPEGMMKKREERLLNFATGKLRWIDTHCELSEEQEVEFKTLFLQYVKELQDQFAKNQQRHNHGFADDAPVRFVVDGAASHFRSSVWKREIEKKLTEEQQKKLNEAVEERNAQLEQIDRDWVFNLLNKELFFTAEQEKIVRKHLSKSMKGISSQQLYSLTDQNYYLKYQQPHKFLSTLDQDLLNPAQKKRLKRVIGGNVNGPASERYITFMSNDGTDSWYETLDQAIEEQQNRLQEIANIQIAFYEVEHGLDQAGINHLQLAAKGTVLYGIDSWKTSTRQQLRQWEERMLQQQFGGGNFGFSISVPQPRSIYQHQLWKNAIAGLEIEASKIAKEREEAAKGIKTRYLLSFFDRELWLTNDQRKQLEEMLLKKMPKNDFQGYEYMYEVVLMAIPLVKFNEGELKKVLEPTQMDTWDCLKDQYQINGRHVTLQMQNMGQFSFNIPD